MAPPRTGEAFVTASGVRPRYSSLRACCAVGPHGMSLKRHHALLPETAVTCHHALLLETVGVMASQGMMALHRPYIACAEKWATRACPRAMPPSLGGTRW